MNNIFEDGDLDVASAVGWNPDRERLDKLIEADKKRNPRAYAPPPEMLFVRPIQDTLEVCEKGDTIKQMFGPFWLEGEVAVLYSPPGVGKSALAVQIGEHLARGVPFPPFTGPVSCPGIFRADTDGSRPAHRVLYLDCELSLIQLAQRYTSVGEDGTSLTDAYQFAPGYLNSKLYWDGRLIDGYTDFTDMLFENLDAKIREHEATVLIVDNITFLSQRSTANASTAFRLMCLLQELKRDRFISILVVAHTPKHPEFHPITMNHLQGSVDIAKVADSIFVLGRSYLKNDLRYVKHVKARTGQIEHGGSSVPVYRLAKFDLAARLGCDNNAVRADNFLGFDFVGFDDETEHLATRPRPARARKRGRSVDRQLKAYAKTLAGLGLSTAEIAKRLGVGKTTAYRYLQGNRGNEKRSVGGEYARSI